MDKTLKITEYFSGVETTEEYNGYFCSVGRTLTIEERSSPTMLNGSRAEESGIR